MKRIALLMLLVVVVTAGIFRHVTQAADANALQTFEYATIRWGGRENTHVIRPNGKTEMLGVLLNKIPRPDHVDDRSLYMNVVMNALAKEGYEFAGMTSDDIVMKRAVAH